MTLVEQVNSLVEKINDLECVDKVLNIFLEDAVNDCKLIDMFYAVYSRIYMAHGGNTKFKEMAIIAKRYADANPDYKYNYKFYYLLATFYYKIGDFEQCAGLTVKFKGRDVPADYAIGAYTLQLNIYQFLGLYNEAGEILNEVLKTPHMANASPYIRGVLYTNAITIATQNGDKDMAKYYYDMVEENFNHVSFEGIGKEIVVKTSYYYYNILSNLDNLEISHKYAIEFYNYVIGNDMHTDFLSQDSDTYVAILDAMKDFYTEKQVFEIVSKLLKEMQPMYRDKLMYYNYLFKTHNSFYKANLEMHEDHIKAAYEYHAENQDHYADSLREVLRLHLIEDKLNILESKYNVDALTECLNRNYLIEIENTIIENGSVVYVDLDKLKQVNDNYGHQSGDMYLKVFANLLKNVFHEEGYQVIRYGGDEFVVLCKNKTLSEVINLVNQLEVHAKEAKLKSINLDEIPFSSGIKEIKEKTTVKNAISNADKLMYKCKQNRKVNQACCYVVS